MNTNIEVLRELDELVEAARLLGVAQAKKLFGCYTDEDRRFERAMYESIDKHRAALLDWEAKQPAPQQPEARGGGEAEPPSAPVGVEAEPSPVRALLEAANAVLAENPSTDGMWTLEQAVRPFNATKPAECADGCPPQQVCDYCQIAALSQQPAAVDAGLAQRIQALVGGVEVDLEAPLSADAGATTQTHGAMLRQLEPQLQEQLAESEHAAAAQAAEIEALRAEVARLEVIAGYGGVSSDAPERLILASEVYDGVQSCDKWCDVRRVVDDGQPMPESATAYVRADRAERLEEALRELVDVFSESGMYDEELFDKARAALAHGGEE